MYFRKQKIYLHFCYFSALRCCRFLKYFPVEDEIVYPAESIHWLLTQKRKGCQGGWLPWACFLSLAESKLRLCLANHRPGYFRSKLRLCSANHRPGYWNNLACEWLSTVWACSKQETENRPRSSLGTLKLVFNISSDEQGNHPDGISVSVWWLGDPRSQGISSHGFDIVFLKHFGFRARKVKFIILLDHLL